MYFFKNLDNLIRTFNQENKYMKIGKTIMNKSNERGLTLPDIKIYCKAIVLKWHSPDMRIDRWITRK